MPKLKRKKKPTPIPEVLKEERLYTIPVVLEEGLNVWAENCCFCGVPTPYWTDLKTRTPGEQVACCPSCANTKDPVEVPSKKKWFEREAGRRLNTNITGKTDCKAGNTNLPGKNLRQRRKMGLG